VKNLDKYTIDKCLLLRIQNKSIFSE